MKRGIYRKLKNRAIIHTPDIQQSKNDSGIDAYSSTLLAIVANLKNSGKPKDFNCTSSVGSSKRETVFLRLFGRADYEREIFEVVSFQAHGCLAMIAAGSAICEMLHGKTWKEALKIQPEDILVALDGVPWKKKHTIYFAVEATRALVGDCLFRAGQKRDTIERFVGCDDQMMDCRLCEHCSLRSTRNALHLKEMEYAERG
ncbi:MAG: iron-sulfur cluster assembly scaffold protein [Coriobacteriales bacterium]|jgi:NifU-like protein involved in Fe-S cluster formation|nr:iron-sulfur cluster assembly scaffold protein [Coriobacteriales bacterium]